MTVSITIDSLADSLFKDLVTITIRQVCVNSLSHRSALLKFTSDESNLLQTIQTGSTSKNIFGQEKTKLKSSETSRYFDCGNCGRKISGGRFASHINKCLDKTRR